MGNVSNPIRTIQTDFRAGEVDPLLAMRIDSKMYPAGASSLKNCILRSGGSVSRRPGSTLLAAIGTVKKRLVPFEYSVTEKYLFAFDAGDLFIYDGAGTQLFMIASMPWDTDAKVNELTYAQAGDTMIVCHKSFRPKVIRRTGATSFTVTDFSFRNAVNGAQIYQPYTKFEAADVTLNPGGSATGTQTIVASAGIFSAAWVGDTIRIFGNEMTVTAFTNATTITVNVKKRLARRLDPNPLLAKANTKVTEVTQPFHGMATGASVTVEGASGADANVTRTQVNGTFSITVVDEDRYTYIHSGGNNYIESNDFGGSAVTIVSASPTRDWDEQAFSARRGWPAAVSFHEDRLWFGGTTSLPDGIWSSRTGSYFDFDVAEGESDASIQVTIGSPRIAAVRHILSGRLLQIFADGGEFVARQSEGVGLTPSTISIRPQTPFGCSNIKPMAFDGATLFVQGNDKTVREFTFDFNQDGFTGTDLTTLSAHLLSGISDAAVFYGSASRTEQYAFFVNADGSMAVFHSNRSEGLAGWVLWTPAGWSTGARYESVCVLGSKAYVSVVRGSARTLEQFELDNSAITLDRASSQTSGTSQTAWNFGSNYASTQCHVTANGYYLGVFTANASGVFTLPSAVRQVTVGFDFPWEIVPLPPEIQLPDGPMTGEPRRIVSANIHVRSSFNLICNGQVVVTTPIGGNLLVAPLPVNGKIKRFLSGWGRDPAVTLQQTQPLPVTVLGMTMEISI